MPQVGYFVANPLTDKERTCLRLPKMEINRTMKEPVSVSQFNELIRPLLSLPLSRLWRGYGSALFLDLGELRPLPRKLPNSRPHLLGEASIQLQWDWRFETDTAIACGSSNSGPRIDAYIAAHQELAIVSLTLEGRPPELTLTFADSQRLHSMSMLQGDPQWRIRLQDHSYLSCENGLLIHKSKDETAIGLSDEEREAVALGDVAASRWNEPRVEPVGGDCRTCRFFVYLDGSFALTEYGGCANAASPFDGRIVNVRSGCPQYTSRE